MNSNSNDRASQNSEAEPTASAVFRTSYPIDCSLEDEEGKSVLYIDDASGVHNHSLSLKVSNTSGRNIELINEEKRSKASEEYHHFELMFRPGVLDDYDKITLKESADWSLGNKQQPDGTISLYFLCRNEKYTINFKEVALTLQQVKASARGGARGTQVELKYANLQYQGEKENFSGNRLQNLSIINHYGRKDIPLHVGFINGDDILNDGITCNELRLRIANTTLKEVSLKPIDSGVSPKFIISFDTGEAETDTGKAKTDTGKAKTDTGEAKTDTGEAKTNPWELGTYSQVKGIKVEVMGPTRTSLWTSVEPKEAPNKTVGSSNQSISPQWEIYIEEWTKLEPGQCFEIKLYNIITSHPSGYTNLYLRYENIPGYWDGEFVCSIEKTPLLYQKGNVGIGTNAPEINLAIGDAKTGLHHPNPGELAIHTNGAEQLRIDKSGNVSIGDSSGEVKLKGEAKLKVSGTAQVQGLQVNSLFLFKKIQAGSFKLKNYSDLTTIADPAMKEDKFKIKGVKIEFQEKFSTPPCVIVTARNERFPTHFIYPDVFAVTVAYTEVDFFEVNIVRVSLDEKGNGRDWYQRMNLDWIAWEF